MFGLALQQAALDAAHAAAGLAVNWLVQSTLLIAMGLAVAWMLQRRGSAVQSAVYRTTLLAAFLCPAASWLLSLAGLAGWALPLPAAYSLRESSGRAEPQVAVVDAPVASSIDGDIELSPPTRDELLSPEQANLIEPSRFEGASSFGDFAALEAENARVAEPPIDSSKPAREVRAPRASSTESPAPAIDLHLFGALAVSTALLWTLIGLVLLARLVASCRRLDRIRRNAAPAAESTLKLCREVAARLNVDPPAVLHSPYLPSPCLAGILRPTVMLPAEEADETSQPLQDVLVHELAHLRRRDCHWNLLRRVAAAVLWFQPLLWLLSRRLESASEEVCDDYVVHFGGDRRHYARRLVDIAELSAAPFAAAGVAMVSFRSMLERRVLRVMDTSRSLSTRVGSALLVLLLVGGAAGTVAVGLVGIGAPSTKAESKEAEGHGNDMKAEVDSDQADASSRIPTDGSGFASNDDKPSLHRQIVGRVLDEAGQPIVGARISVVRSHLLAREPRPKFDYRLIAETKSGAEGAFDVEFDAFDAALDEDRQGWQLIASAPGYGPAWTSHHHLYRTSTAELTLTPDKPIAGSLVDLEGMPLAGVRVRIDELWTAKEEQAIVEWINEVKANPPADARDRRWTEDASPSFPADWQYGSLNRGVAGLPGEVITDERGRFELRNVGANRLAVLVLEGDQIATTWLSVLTRETETFEAYPVAPDRFRSHAHYGAAFQHVAEPTQLVLGQVRDAETGDPIPNVEVQLVHFAGDMMTQLGFIRTCTDARGRYRLAGLPVGGGHEIAVVPSLEQPYFLTEQELPKVAADAGPIECDFDLRRGVWVTGTVTERETGRPLADAVVEYLPLRSNTNATNYDNYDPEITGQVPSNRFATNHRGEFRVLAIPGPGVLGAILEQGELAHFSSLKPADLPRHLIGDGDLLNAYHPWIATGYYALQEIKVTDIGQHGPYNLQCTRGATRQIAFVDADGRPVEGVRILGRKFPPNYESALKGSETTLVGLNPGEERIVAVIHAERRLARALKTSTGDRLTVKLQPCAIARGRIVDEDDAPLADLLVEVRLEGSDTWARQLEEVRTDAEGRFEVLLPPGLPVNVVHYSEARDVSAECRPIPGAIFELGDLHDGDKLTIEQTTSMLAADATGGANDSRGPNPAPTSGRREPLEFAGAVVTPDGQPAAGADVYLVYHVPEPTGLLRPTWKPIAQTNAEGKFRITLDKTAPEYASLVAVKEGFGFARSELALHETSGRLLNEAKARAEKAPGIYREHLLEQLERAGRPLQLVADDEPIRGRIVDINGQPVAGALLTLTEVSASLDGDLSAWRAAAAEPKADYYSARAATPLMLNGPQVRSLVEPAATDADGRFTLAGIGLGRIVTLLLEGPGIESAKVLARTEAGEPIELERERRVPHGTYVYHPAEFTHVAGPSVPIVGVVRDEQTKAPLAGVTVKSQARHGEVISGWGQDFVRAVTDDEGRYRLHGMPIGEENRIAAIAPDDKPYLSMSAETPTLAGEESATIDFDLHRGVWIEGRVTDKHTGEGLAGRLEYYVPRDNPNYGRGRSMNVDQRDRLRADKDGRYRIVGFSGRGYVAFMAEKHEQYPRADHLILADGSRKKVDGYLTDTEPSYLMAANNHAVAEINPAEGALRHELNLQLDSGGTVTGRVVDADGRPVSGFYYSGRLAEFDAWRPGDNDALDITGYDASEGRDVYVVQRERNLAGHVRITGEPTRELTVSLQPAGTVKGRVVDESGAPLANLALVRWSSPIASPADINKVRSAPPLPLASESTQLGEYETDADGRFEIPGLVPGVEYRISVFDRKSMRPTPARTPRPSGPLDRVIVVKPGETLELGDVGIAERDKFAAAEKAAEKPTGAGSEQAEPAAAAGDSQPKPSPPPAAGRNNDNAVDDNATDAKRDTAVTGRVTDDQGRPIAGAKLYGIVWSLRGPQPEPQLLATTDKSGDFSFPRPAMQFSSGETGARRPNFQFVVTAPSHGMRLLRTDELTRPAPNVLGAIAQALSGATPKTSLVELPSAVPIRGRVVDVDGQPVAGVRVTLRKITRQKDPLLEMTRQSIPAGQQPENLDWQARVLSLQRQFYPAKLPAVAPSATSDADGRFTLNGIGAESVVELLIEGPGIQSDRVLVRTEPGQAITMKAGGNFELENRVLNGAEFVHVAGPSKPVSGRVLDFDTGAPIAGAVVRAYSIHGERLSSSRERQHLLAATDQEGRYEITGLPVGDGNRLVAFTDGDVPYVPVGAVADTSPAQGALTLDFQLKRGVWAKGKVYDAQTKAPLTGELTYYIPIDPKLKEELPGLRLAFVDEHYFTTAQGEFRVPVLAGRGILAFRYDPAGMGDSAQYPRGMGADAIEGFNSDGGLPMLETWPHYLVPANYHLVKEIRPHEGVESVTVDLPLSRGKEIVVHPVDANGQRLAGVEYYGRNDASLFVTAEDGACQVMNLLPGEKRKLFFYHRSRNLAGAVVVDENTADGAEVTLRPAATITGRLVDEDGTLIDDATLVPTLEKLREDERAAMWPPADPDATSGTDRVSAAGGAFRIVGLVPGWKYNAWASAPRKLNGTMQSMGIGRVFDDLELAPGEDRNLGDLVVSYDDKKTASPKRNPNPLEDDKRPENQPNSATSPPGVKIHGQVRGPNGEPIGGVQVAVISLPITPRRGGDYGISEAPVFEATADDGGRYELQLTGLSPDTHPYTSLIVRAPELGLAWKRIDLNESEVDASVQLQPEQPLVIRLVDIEGQPAAGVSVTVSSIMPTISETQQFSEDGVGIWGGVKAPAAWFPPVTTSDSGELVIDHVPANHGVNLKIAPHERFAPQDLAINTGMPEQRGERDATYRSQVINNVKPGDVPSIPLSPAQWFTGIITYEDTGEPAPHARVTIWASQQQYGSMSSVAGTADAKGRYRINPEPGIRFGVTAYPPDGAAYLPRQMEPVSWDAGDRSKTVDVALPRGVLVRGQVIEEDSQEPVAGASVQYLPETANNKSVPENTITGWQDRRIADEAGRFETVVPPGPGRLLVHGPRNDYQIVQFSSREISRGRPGGERNYAHAIERIEPAPNAEPHEVTLKLKRGAVVTGELVDGNGEPIESALLISRLTIHANWLDWHAHTSRQVTGGRFEIGGLTPGEEYNVLFLDPQYKRGAVAILKAGMTPPRITLQPCGKVKMRLVDKQGNPLAEHSPSIHLVVTPGAYQFDNEAMQRGELAADADFI